MNYLTYDRLVESAGYLVKVPAVMTRDEHTDPVVAQVQGSFRREREQKNSEGSRRR